MTMTHPGLPQAWGMLVWGVMLAASLWALFRPLKAPAAPWHYSLERLPLLGGFIRWAANRPWLLLALRILIVALFLLVIAAGLFGTPIPERNLATLLTWNIWWAGLIVSIFFLGSAWCGVCPWDTLATWLVRRRLWRRAEPNNSLNLRVPRAIRNIWPALLLFIGLTWLELGVGVTTSPYATALLALLMVVLATVSLAIYERRAFCRYFCPVGRTIGFYAQLAPVELRPVDPDVCARCETLDCYYGNEQIEPCPTHLVMGRLTQNTYCTSCGNCSQACPHQNVAWRLRSPAAEAAAGARPHWDEAWFMLGLLALTGFHGLTMMPFWEDWMRDFARVIGDSGQLLWTFSLGLVGVLTVPLAFYTLAAWWTARLAGTTLPFRRAFSQLAFVAIPLAFAYHLAHNLNHLLREGRGLGEVLLNPLGIDTLPLTMAEKHARMVMPIPQDLLFAIQAGLMIFGFLIALKVIRSRGRALFNGGTAPSMWRLSPVLGFAIAMTAFHLWLLMQPMIMRM